MIVSFMCACVKHNPRHCDCLVIRLGFALPSDNKIALEGAGAIAAALDANEDVRLESLNLYSCGIGDSGASAIAALLERNTSLKVVNLFGAYIRAHWQLCVCVCVCVCGRVGKSRRTAQGMELGSRAP